MIVITAPTGLIGAQVLSNVLGSGEPVRVIARDPSRLPAQARERVEVVHGPEELSFNDMAQIMSEVLGKPVRYQQIPPRPSRTGSPEPGCPTRWRRPRST